MFNNKIYLIILCLVFWGFGGCASTKQAALPTAWRTSINWDNYSSAEFTATEDVILQNETDIYVRDGATGKVLFKDIKESKGFFGQLGDQVKSQALGGLASKDKVEFKYWTLTLPESQTLLLFDRSTDAGEIRSIDLQSGGELWNSSLLQWNLKKYRDTAGELVDLASRISIASGAAAGLASEVLLESRAVRSMISEVPGKNAFLFKTTDGHLHMVNAKTGDSIWQTDQVPSTGLAAVKYLPDSDELLVIGDMGGLKDIIKSADANNTMKQVYRIDASDGAIRWASKYQGRESQVDHILKTNNKVLVYFTGGSLEFFDYLSGKRLFGTRDDMAIGTTKVASAVSKTNTMETEQTAMPILEGNAVYAINPTGDVNAMALDDKQLVKYNSQTGDVIWKSPVLEKTVDVRQMTVTDNWVIVQIPGAGNVVGGAKESGVYAFNKSTGEEAWNFSEPISKSYAANILYRDADLLTGDGDILYQLRLADGSLESKKSFEDTDLGDISAIQALSDTVLSVVGSGGFALLDSRELTPIYQGAVRGRMSSHYASDRMLLAKSKKLLSQTPSLAAFDLNHRKEIAGFSLTNIKGKLYGNLATEGYFPIDDMTRVLTINDSGITTYKL